MGGYFFVEDVWSTIAFRTDWATELTTFDCFVSIVGSVGGIHGAIVLSEHIGGQGGSHTRKNITILCFFFLDIVVDS